MGIGQRVLRAGRRHGAEAWARVALRVSRRPLTVAVGFARWKRPWLRRLFADRLLVFLPDDLPAADFERHPAARRLAREAGSELLVWGLRAPAYVAAFAARHGRRLGHVEDGFLRSRGLGAAHTAPLSVCVDWHTPYFDARRPSDLERLLASHDFASDAVLLRRAERALSQLLQHGLSKYNHAAPADLARLYGPKRARRVLVLGQVEDDASIRYGCDRALTNNELVRLAAAEHPGAQIIYKPHPDVLLGHRAALSQPRDVAHLCLVVGQDLPLAQAFETVDHVYTISSLGGFEALMRGLPVTTLGCPFYAGWGLTDDRQANPRRQRHLSVRELFAGAYLLYPRYFEPATGRPLEFEDVLQTLLDTAAVPALAQRARRALRSAFRPAPLGPSRGPADLALSLYVP